MMETLIKVLRIASLILIPITTLVVMVWIILHDPFEEVLRNVLAIILFVLMSDKWVDVFISKWRGV